VHAMAGRLQWRAAEARVQHAWRNYLAPVFRFRARIAVTDRGRGAARSTTRRRGYHGAATVTGVARGPRCERRLGPGHALDAGSVENLRRTLTKLLGQMTIVIATHDVRLASLADQTLDLAAMRSRAPLAVVGEDFVGGPRSMDSR